MSTTSPTPSNAAPQPNPSTKLLAVTYIMHALIAFASIAVSQMTLLLQTDPEWGEVLADRPWLLQVGVGISAILGVVLYRYSQWAKIHLGVTHRNALLLLVLSALFVWLVLA